MAPCEVGQTVARLAFAFTVDAYVRKVRAPEGRMLANGQAGRPDGKCRRKEDSHLRGLGLVSRLVKGKAETVV